MNKSDFQLIMTLDDQTRVIASGDGAGAVESILICTPEGSRTTVPGCGTLVDLCSRYPTDESVIEAVLFLDNESTILADTVGDGAISLFDPECEPPSRNMLEVALMHQQAGYASMANDLGTYVRVGDLPVVAGSCGSSISLIDADVDYRASMLFASMQPDTAGQIQRYRIGGDVIHVFLSGTGRFLTTRDGQDHVEIVDIDATDHGSMVLAVAPAGEFYQVVNTSTDRELTYFWIHVDHQRAHERGTYEELPARSTEAQGLGFQS